MRLQKILLAAILGLASLSTSADWQPYFGIGVIGQNSSLKTTVNNPPLASAIWPSNNDSDTAPAPYNFNANKNSILPSVQLGIGNTFTNHIYLGFEINTSYNYANLNSNTINDTAYNNISVDGSFSNKVNTTLPWQINGLARLGYDATPNLMPFVEAGIATADANSTYYFDKIYDSVSPLTGSVFTTHQRIWLYGPTAGIGADYKLTQNIHLFGKADYAVLFGSATPDISPTTFEGGAYAVASPFKQDYRFTTWSAELGANYYF